MDIRTDWTDQRALENRGQPCTLRQLQDVEASLPFALLGLNSDNDGEFLNHHVVAWTGQRPRPILLTRSRPYQKNDNAHVEQRNWMHRDIERQKKGIEARRLLGA
ncbi:MAG: hypothetical protein WHU94_15270 [Thermogemmata sp.]